MTFLKSLLKIKGGEILNRIDIYISNELKKLIEERAKELNIKVSEYFRMLSIYDISKQQLKLLYSKENQLIDNINNIENKLDMTEV
jgi:hypothetical protein